MGRQRQRALLVWSAGSSSEFNPEAILLHQSSPASLRLLALCLHSMKDDQPRLGSLSQRLATPIFAVRPELRRTQRWSKAPRLTVYRSSFARPPRLRTKPGRSWCGSIKRLRPASDLVQTIHMKARTMRALLQFWILCLPDQVVIIEEVEIIPASASGWICASPMHWRTS